MPGYSAERKTLVFFGDSLTEGYGIEREQAYPALIQEKVDQAGLPFEVVNAGLSGDTTAAGLRRVSWVLRRDVDVFVLALGANDGLRGIPVVETERNLRAIIETVVDRQPDAHVVIFGMEALPNMGEEFRDDFRSVFPRVAQSYDLPYLPFFLEGVGAVPELNLSDGIHPNEQGHERITENVWRFLLPLLDGRDVES